MPKAQPKRTASSRADPLASRDANSTRKKASKGKAAASTQPPESDARRTGQDATADSNESDWNYLVLVGIARTEEPMVSRLLALPPKLHFDKLHEILQVAFGWTDSHMHVFEVQQISAPGPFPPTLLSLYTHPDSFQIEGDDEPKANERDWTLADVFEKEGWKGNVKITYEYDTGDGWEHDICLLGRQMPSSIEQLQVPSDMKAVCLTGQGHPCAEDCGGPSGWHELKELFAKPRMKDEDGKRQWFKRSCYNGDPKGLEPHKWDFYGVNEGISHIKF